MARELTKDEIAVRESISRMTRGEKIAYYLGTYKFYILGVALVAGILISIAYTVITNTQPVFFAGIINQSNFERDYFEESVAKALHLETDESVCVYDELGTQVSYSSGYYNLINMYVMADELTVVFTDWEGAEYIGALGTVTEASGWMTEDLMSIWGDRIMELNVGVDQTEDFEPIFEEYPVVVDISGTKVMEKLGLDEDTCYMIGVCTYACPEKVIDFSHYLYDLETGE